MLEKAEPESKLDPPVELIKLQNEVAPPHHRIPRWLLAVGVAAIVAIGGSGTFYYFRGLPFYPFDNERFNAAAWKKAHGEGRAVMCSDLMRHHLPAGMTAQQVVALLGQPDEITPGHPGWPVMTRGKHFYMYYIGGWSTYGMDSCYLYVDFDSADRVIYTKIDGF